MPHADRADAGVMLRMRHTWSASFGALLPRWMVDLLVAASVTLTAVLSRVVIETIAGGVVPFALTFPAVLAATLLAGARAGGFAAVSCQLLTIQYVFPNWLKDHGADRAALVNLALTTASLAVIVWAASSYRTMSHELRRRCQREVETLSLFVREMDHRTKNNFQIAAHLLSDQARGADAGVAQELEKASARLHSIASVYRNLMLISDRSDSLDLGGYLDEVVALLRQGIVPPGIKLSITSVEVSIASHTAMIVGLLVNEWIVNAVKYAFPEGSGTIKVLVDRQGPELVVTVRDDGHGGKGLSSGAGSRLMNGLAATIGGSLTFSRETGTVCILHLQDAALQSS